MVPEHPDHAASPSSETRVSDADRERMVTILREQCADGRLSLDEFSERVGEALAARTVGDLETVTRHLPVLAQPVAQPEIVGQTTTRRTTRWTVAIMGGSERKGRWRVRGTTNAFALMGGCKLDLRGAEVEGGEIIINAIAIMGGIDVIVPEGIEVELSGIPIMGGKDLKLADVPRLPGSPLVRVRAFALMGGVGVKSRKSPEIERQEREERWAKRAERAERFIGKDLRHELRNDLRNELRHRSDQVLAAVTDTPQAMAETREAMRPAAAPDGTVTIMFSDIVGFTAMTERLGDLRAQQVLRRHNDIIRRQFGECDGYEVKAQGDGFMVAFAGASKAVRCAIGIQKALLDDAMAHPEDPVQVRIGIHTGEAIKEADDFLGSTVILAARIADQAGGGEILVSSLLKELTSGSGEFTFGSAREVMLKGISEPRVVHPVVWSPNG